MRIYVKVTTRSAKNEIAKISEGEYRVRVSAVPEKGKANEAVRELIADYFRVGKNRVKIIAGKSAKTKLLEIG